MREVAVGTRYRLIYSAVKTAEAQRACSDFCGGGGWWEFTHAIDRKHFPSKQS